jgi:hypothetical protein
MILYDTAKRALADGEISFGQPVTLRADHIVVYETGRPRDARGRFRRRYVGVFEVNPDGDTEITADMDGTFDVRVTG